MKYGSSEPMRYRDFVLELRSQPRGAFSARVVASPAGESEEYRLQLSVSPGDIEDTLASVTYSSGNFLKRSKPSGTYDPVITLGERLFQDLVRESPIGRLFRQTQELTQSRSEGLRLRIVAQDQAVLAIPWEFLFDSTQSSFLALSLRTPVVRRLADAPSHQLKPVDLPLRCLVVSAEVNDFDADQEIAILRELGQNSGMLDLQVVDAATFSAFRQALGAYQPHIVHFIATGAYGNRRGRWSTAKPAMASGDNQGLLFLGEQNEHEDQLESADFVPAAELGEALQEDRELRFVVLNGCDTDLVAAELSRQTPAVLGIRARVLSWTCQAMTQGLYEALLDHQPLEAAVTAGRQEVDRRHPGTREWGLPTFYLSAAHGILLTAEGKRSTSALDSTPESTAADTGSTVVGGLTTLTAADVREQRRLQSLLDLEMRNRDLLRAQQNTLGEATPEFIKSQLIEAEQKVADLQTKLQAYPLQS